MRDITFVKYCPLCGAENPRQQAFCLRCFDGDLSVVPVEPRRKDAPTPPGEAPTAQEPTTAPDTKQIAPLPRCVLELIDDPSIRFSVLEGQTVGRTEKADIVLHGVPKLDWISGIHARFFRRGEQWYVQHLGGTNFIKVDGETFKGREEAALHDGAILVISLTPFRVTFTEA